MKRSEKALEYYSNGFNCAQSVIISFADILDFDEEAAIRMASGFGGGMGQMQQTCGAVTGAFMVIGYLRGKYKDGDEQANEKINELKASSTFNLKTRPIDTVRNLEKIFDRNVRFSNFPIP